MIFQEKVDQRDVDQRILLHVVVLKNLSLVAARSHCSVFY